MANSTMLQKNAWALVAFMLVFGGMTFSYYVWTGTKIDPDQPPDGTYESGSAPVMTRIYPLMSASIEERPQGVTAVVTLSNNSATKIVMPETTNLPLLYPVSLKYRPNVGSNSVDLKPNAVRASTGPAAPPPPLGTVQVIDPAAVKFDPARDTVIELLPGSTHTVSLPLQPAYELKPGKYELIVRFVPLNLVSATSAPLPAFNVNVAGCRVAFDLPLGNKPPIPKTEVPKTDGTAQKTNEVKKPDEIKKAEAPTSN